LRLLDLFSGIGGFHLGFERAGFEFDYVGFAEVDKYASAVYKYNFPFAEELGDVKSIRSENLPKIDIITFGSPCQDFSISGKRAGATRGTRSSLIWEAIRLIDECKPRIFVWENVKGTFSSNNGTDFWAIIQAFTNIGSYRLEWQLLNTRWFPRTPQNRERIYLVGYTGDRGGRSVFPIGEDGSAYNINQARTKPKTKFYTSITTKEGGRKENNFVIVDKKRHKKNNQDYAATLCGNGHSGGNHSDMDLIQTFTERSFDGKRADGGRAICYHKVPGETPCLSSQMGMGGNNVPMLKVGNIYKSNGENGNVYNPNGISPSLKSGTTNNPKHGGIGSSNAPKIINQTSIRRLTPVECMRLQGFPDNHNEFGLLDGKKVAISDTQRYKQAGNAVTVDVVTAVAKKIRSLKLSTEKGW
jgi:DNA (cytosine-5)-methyltransferase 1